ncbi:MAG: GAF domain-containing protein [Pseudomonadales bacterium]
MHKLLALHQQIHRALNDEQAKQQVFSDLCELYRQSIGLDLFTLLVVHPNNSHTVRLYSSEATHYPMMETRPIVHNSWHENVMLRGETFYAASMDEIQPFFSDWPTLQQLELSSMLSIPTMLGKQCTGVINILHRSKHAYDHCDRYLLSQYAQLMGPLLCQWRVQQTI